MRCRFAFSQTSDGRLLVTMEAVWGFPPGQNGKFCISAIDDENTFIQHVVLANLEKDVTVEIIAAVLLVVSGREPSDRWVAATLSQMQLTALGMHIRSDDLGDDEAAALSFAHPEDLARVFMQSPLALCMLSGPEHVVTFINPTYVRIIGRTTDETILGKPIREALSDLEGQQFFPLLDKVFETGKPFVGIEEPAKLFHDESGVVKERFFDFIYYPVRDSDGNVAGILCQATDVTERVLEKSVRESREEQLYRQWAEMNALYREAPFGMCLISANNFSILRVNEIKAKLLGGTVEDLVGKKMTDIYPDHPFIPEAYSNVVKQKSSMNFELTTDLPSDPGNMRSWWWNLNPVFDASGEVESIISIVIELTEKPTIINTNLAASVAAAN